MSRLRKALLQTSPPTFSQVSSGGTLTRLPILYYSSGSNQLCRRRRLLQATRLIKWAICCHWSTKVSKRTRSKSWSTLRWVAKFSLRPLPLRLRQYPCQRGGRTTTSSMNSTWAKRRWRSKTPVKRRVQLTRSTLPESRTCMRSHNNKIKWTLTIQFRRSSTPHW